MCSPSLSCHLKETKQDKKYVFWNWKIQVILAPIFCAVLELFPMLIPCVFSYLSFSYFCWSETQICAWCWYDERVWPLWVRHVVLLWYKCLCPFKIHVLKFNPKCEVKRWDLWETTLRNGINAFVRF